MKGEGGNLAYFVFLQKIMVKGEFALYYICSLIFNRIYFYLYYSFMFTVLLECLQLGILR